MQTTRPQQEQCPSHKVMRGIDAADDEELSAQPVPTLDGDTGDEALPPVMPHSPAPPLPGASLAVPLPAPPRAQAHPAGGHTAGSAPQGGSGGDVNVALGATALTALLGSGAHFSLDDAVRAGGVQMPPAAGLQGKPTCPAGQRTAEDGALQERKRAQQAQALIEGGA